MPDPAEVLRKLGIDPLASHQSSKNLLEWLRAGHGFPLPERVEQVIAAQKKYAEKAVSDASGRRGKALYIFRRGPASMGIGLDAMVEWEDTGRRTATALTNLKLIV